MNLRKLYKLTGGGFLAAAMLFTGDLNAQHLTLEGQTGGFLTPTAYVVYSEKGQTFSHPAVGFHFVNTSAVIGNIETFNITEGFANRAEIGYSRTTHQLGNQTTGLDLSALWNYSGINIFHGKVIAIKDGQFCPFTPGIAIGGVVRTNDQFVSGAIPQVVAAEFGQSVAAKSYSNGDVYIAATKTWLHPPVPFLVNFGLKFTNASIYGIGGQSTRFAGRLFGGIGIPLPGPFGTAIVPSAGFTQQPKTAVNLGTLLPITGAHIPTTLDYAVRLTQAKEPHFSFDIGIGQVAGQIGSTLVPTGLRAPAPPYVSVPVNLQARHVLGMGLSYRY